MEGRGRLEVLYVYPRYVDLTMCALTSTCWPSLCDLNVTMETQWGCQFSVLCPMTTP